MFPYDEEASIVLQIVARVDTPNSRVLVKERTVQDKEMQ